MKPRRLTAALWICVALAALRLTIVSTLAVSTPSNGFVAYYTPARMLLEGVDAARFYDDEYFGLQVRRFEPDVADIFWANPPTMSVLLLPLAWLDYPTARAIWIEGNLLLWLGVVAWLTRRLGGEGWRTPSLVFLALIAEPVRDNQMHGQAYVLMCALLTVAWWGYRRGRDGLLGTSGGVVVGTKTAALPVWPLLLVQRRWIAIGAGAFTALALVLLTLPWIGMSAWWRYLDAAKALPSNRYLAVTNYQTLLGFFRHLFGPGGGASIGEPWLRMPALGDAPAFLVGAAMLLVTLLIAYRRDASDAVFAAAVLLGIIVSPVSSDAHYTMALLPLALVRAPMQQRADPTSTIAWWVAAFLLVVPYPITSPQLANGAIALLAYPRLYGALVLWSLAVRESPRRAARSDGQEGARSPLHRAG